MIFLNKLKNRLKQYGLKNGLKRFFLKLISPFLIIKEDLILAHTSKRKPTIKSRVEVMNMSKINTWLNNHIISKEEHNKFNYFLSKKCKGYYIIENNTLAAWGFVDFNGEYKYGNYFYTIPAKIHILRNLFVKPEFRGKSYGKWINETRLNNIPEDCIPVGFVIPENRYAIRNLKMFGFEEILLVQHYCWFHRWGKRKVKVIKDGKITNILLNGFK